MVPQSPQSGELIFREGRPFFKPGSYRHFAGGWREATLLLDRV